MALFRVPPSKPDLAVANAIAERTSPPTEKVAAALTWGADENVLIALAASLWIYSRTRNAEERRVGDHVLLVTVVASALPHLLKQLFDQRRPDRLTVKGHWRGVPLSGNALDAFPSGHAVHVGALASAATMLPPRRRYAAWGVGSVLLVTRVVLLAHWMSDVVVGAVVGALAERALRRVTGVGRRIEGGDAPAQASGPA